MALTPEEMRKMIVQLEKLCAEAQELQDRLRRAMTQRTRDDMPFRPRQVERRKRRRPDKSP